MRPAASLPTLSIGDRITFEGCEHQIVGLHGIRDCNELALRLRGADGALTIVALSVIYADLASQAAGASSPATTTLTLRHPTQLPDDDELPEPFDYLGPALTAQAGPQWEPDESQRADEASMPLGENDVDVDAMLSVLPFAVQNEATTREGHVLEVLTGYQSGDPEGAKQKEPRPQYDPELTTKTGRVQSKAAELGMSSAQMWRWCRDYRDYGLWGLVDGRAKREENALVGLDPRLIQAIVEQDLAEVHHSTGTWKRFYGRLQRRLRDDKYAGVECPPAETLYEKVRHILKKHYTLDTAKRRRSRSLSPKKTHEHMRAFYPGHIVLMDSTKLDVTAYDPVYDVELGVTLCWAVDVFSRSLVAWRLVPQTENQVDASMLLIDMMRPEPMRPHWQEALAFRLLGLPDNDMIRHDARFEGAAARPVIYPQIIVFDHGKVYVSKSMRRACDRFGITIQNARILQPTDKAQVETSFRTLGFNFSQHVAGHTGRNPNERGQLSDKLARWTIAELQEFMDYYIVAIYQRTPHSGLPFPHDPKRHMTPNEAYVAAVTTFGWVAAPVSDTFYYELLPFKWCVIHNYGVNLDYRKHNDDILRVYEDEPIPYPAPFTSHGERPGRSYGKRQKQGKVPVRYDPRDLTYAYFYAWNEKRWYGLEWKEAPAALAPFSQSYFKNVRKLMKERGLDHTKGVEIGAELLRLQELMDAPESSTLTTRRQFSTMAERHRAAQRDRARSAPLANEADLNHLAFEDGADTDEVSEQDMPTTPESTQAGKAAKSKRSARRLRSTGGLFGIDPSTVQPLRLVREQGEGA